MINHRTVIDYTLGSTFRKVSYSIKLLNFFVTVAETLYILIKSNIALAVTSDCIRLFL